MFIYIVFSNIKMRVWVSNRNKPKTNVDYTYYKWIFSNDFPKRFLINHTWNARLFFNPKSRLNAIKAIFIKTIICYEKNWEWLLKSTINYSINKVFKASKLKFNCFYKCNFNIDNCGSK